MRGMLFLNYYYHYWIKYHLYRFLLFFIVLVLIPSSFICMFIDFILKRSFGSVHKAVHKASGYTIAIKIVQIEFDADESSSIQREINILKAGIQNIT